MSQGKRRTPEQIINYLREAEVLLSQGHIRAILLARAIAAILTDRRSMSLTSQGWRV